jgi:hypothetical protein
MSAGSASVPKTIVVVAFCPPLADATSPVVTSATAMTTPSLNALDLTWLLSMDADGSMKRAARAA